MTMMMEIMKRGLVVGDRARKGMCGSGEETEGMRSLSGLGRRERGVGSVSLRVCCGAGGCGRRAAVRRAS